MFYYEVLTLIIVFKKHLFSKEVWKTSLARTLGAGNNLHKWITACLQTESTAHGKQPVSSDFNIEEKKISKAKWL